MRERSLRTSALSRGSRDSSEERCGVSGGGVLIDNGTHSLDVMRFLVGSLSEIRVVEGKRLQNLPVEDTVHVLENGCPTNRSS